MHKLTYTRRRPEGLCIRPLTAPTKDGLPFTTKCAVSIESTESRRHDPLHNSVRYPRARILVKRILLYGGFLSVCGQSYRNHRSEERRVGKECRSRWSPYH